MSADDNGLRQAAPLGASYVMGTFNDNFFKQAALLLAVGVGNAAFQARATFVFALPFVLFSAWSGWLADRFPKKRLVIAAKALELAAMLAGAWGMVMLDWTWLLAMIFCMGLSSTLFSPALNGSIPELFPVGAVPRVNALFKLGTTASILCGVCLAGLSLDQTWLDTVQPFGRWLVAAVAVLVAAAGLVAALFIEARPGAGSVRPFPWSALVDSFRHLREARRDRPLYLTIWAEAFFYALSTLLLLEINALGRGELGLSYTVTSLLPVALMVGICAGSLLAARGTPESWRALLAPSLFGIGLLLCLVPLAANAPQAWRFPLLFLIYAAAGTCGGLYLIPVTSFVQVRPAPTEKGRILALDNCLSFCGILLAGQAYLPLSALRASSGHFVLGLLCFGAGLIFLMGIRRMGGLAAAPLASSPLACAADKDDRAASSPVAASALYASASPSALSPACAGAQGAASLAASPQAPVPAAFASLPSPAGPASPALAPASSGLGGGPTSDRADRGRFRPSLALRLLLPVARALLGLRYRVRVDGLDAVRARDDGRPILFLPNHPALIDPALVYTALADYTPRPLGDVHQMDRPVIRSVASLLGTIPIPDLRRDGRRAAKGVHEALGRVAEALRAGVNILLYPAGGLSRDGKERLGGNRGAHDLREAVPGARVVLVRTAGLWGTSFSWARGTAPDSLRGLARGAALLLLNGLFFMPRREVRMSLLEPELPDPAEGVRAFNAALEAFYNAGDEPALAVPEHFLRGAAPRPLPTREAENATDGEERPAADMDPALREAVLSLLRDESGAEDIPDGAALSADLGIDSLALVNVAAGLEELSGRPVEELEDLRTVADCFLAASGRLGSARDAAEAPGAWFASGPALPLSVPAGSDLVEAAFRQAASAPSRLMLADGGTALTAREVITRALALSAFVRARTRDEARVGIMLPASSAAALTWLAVLIAGKVPVMCNWTAGPANFAHGLKATGARHVLTSSRLLERLAGQGFPVDNHADAWIALEDAPASLSLLDKIGAFLRARLLSLPLVGAAAMPRGVPGTAAILFTSGSESLPKAVPLSHANMLANCRDIAAVLRLTTHDRMLAMLPPFHSLGLTGNIALPLLFGLPAVYHANPTEGARLAALARRWRPTVTVAPPTFLDGMIRKARPGDLTSLRLGFVGAEKCPDALHAAFAAISGGVLCEGYGVTECAPAVSVNRPEDVRPGTIGLPLPSVRTAVVTPETPPRRVAPEETGMLLVSGPNVFGGYLGVEPDKQPFVAFEGRTWYRTGDLVSEDEDGRLTFRGRLKRFVKIGGEMISLPQIEDALLAAFGERAEGEGPALAVESGDDAAIVLFAALPVTREEANAALRRAGLSGLSSVARVLRLPALPVLGTGKTDYRALRTLCTQTDQGVSTLNGGK
ncbi:MFS transporter [uncultured Bilophila sp.]|uniref:MFS transporter n=10 Tax=uncultured Bilophila sp. TaxID=529385 RepID=UPI00264A0650|nr:MFS transporter [uncultured Bilophila sp.]